jgi:hypothetical protein
MRVLVHRVYRGPGPLAGSELRLLFPGSRDILYVGAPRPSAGSEYLIMARRIGRLPERFRVGLDSATTWVIFESLDVLPPADSVAVTTLPTG